MKTEFLKNWRGSATFGQQNQWKRAQGSSLKPDEVKTVNAGGIARHPKSKTQTKVFVQDDEGNLWSVIVLNVHLAALEADLKKVGYLLAAA